MSIIIDKSLILNRIKQHYSFRNDADFARFLGIKPQTLSSWYTRNTFDIDLLYSKCVDIDANWLLTGAGEMLKSEISVEKELKGIPLIPVEAMAGYGNGSIQVMEYETEHFMVPTFKGADYLIGVRGSSMYPKYNSGDIVACKHLAIDAFFQWNKVYVLDTIQGALIKRVCKGSDENHVLIVSDNTKYDSFELHRSEIHAIAIVMGVIRLE